MVIFNQVLLGNGYGIVQWRQMHFGEEWRIKGMEVRREVGIQME